MPSPCNSPLDPDKAAVIIQRKWRSYMDILVFKYLQRLLVYSKELVAEDFLKYINPREAALADTAAGLVVRLRLNGERFPPTICYKIFTYRPVKDLGITSPKNYAFKKRDGVAYWNNRNSFSMSRCQQETCHKLTRKQNWYKRVDGNDWRPITDEMLVAFVPNLIFPNRNKLTVRKPQFRKVRPNYSTKAEGNSKYVPLATKVDFYPAFLDLPKNVTAREDELEDDDLVAWTQKLDFDKYIQELEGLAKL
ncbi:unnamed protein product [Dibothriocephalus latus]|uniref:Uncharacterized protein n=1 Tax=Dibothriocephalus latus TaxID=60516 RepID=A0A3P7LRH2_DIBLA|nr:unnamed protein product [Dibothriocephalus latus]